MNRESREQGDNDRESRQKCSPKCQPDPTARQTCNLWWNHLDGERMPGGKAEPWLPLFWPGVDPAGSSYSVSGGKLTLG